MEENRINDKISYDVVELPSRGIHYENKIKSVRVSYLTASDENILSSPNLIATNKIIPELLKRKILDKNINVDELVEEDKQAILIFLRNTAYGSEYKMSLKDPKTQKDFEEKIDLSTLSFKKFELISDEDGEFNYHMEKSNYDIKFKFLNKIQEDELKKIATEWKGEGVPPIKTKELSFMIKSINGERDPLRLFNLIDKLPIKDAQDFRKFVNNNKPGLDLTRTVKTPSGEEIQVEIGLGIEFFRPFYGV